MKNLLEIGKSLLIVVLVCTLVLLALVSVPAETIRDNPQLSKYLQPLAPLLGLAEAELAYVETALPALDAAQPTAISVSNSLGRSTAMWDFSALDAAFETFGGLLGQALDTADLFTATSDAQLRRALSGRSVYFRYDATLPVPLLASWLGGELEAAVPASNDCLLSLEGDVVALYLPGTPHFRAVTQVRPEALEPLVEQARPDGSQFAFETDSHLDPMVLLPGSSVLVPGMTASNPCDTRYIDQLATDLGFNPYGETRFTDDDGTTYFSEANTNLEISATGLIRMNTSAPDRFRAASGDAEALVELARQLVDIATGSLTTDGRIYLSGLEQNAGTTICTFDYLLSGIPVRRSGNAAQIIFTGQSVSSLEIHVTAFRSTGETIYPLPVSQAAAILPDDSMLTLEYHLSGSTLTAGWKE